MEVEELGARGSDADADDEGGSAPADAEAEGDGAGDDVVSDASTQVFDSSDDVPDQNGRKWADRAKVRHGSDAEVLDLVSDSGDTVPYTAAADGPSDGVEAHSAKKRDRCANGQDESARKKSCTEIPVYDADTVVFSPEKPGEASTPSPKQTPEPEPLIDGQRVCKQCGRGTIQECASCEAPLCGNCRNCTNFAEDINAAKCLACCTPTNMINLADIEDLTPPLRPRGTRPLMRKTQSAPVPSFSSRKRSREQMEAARATVFERSRSKKLRFKPPGQCLCCFMPRLICPLASNPTSDLLRTVTLTSHATSTMFQA